MKKSDINQPPCYFDIYINCIADLELFEAFSQSRLALEQLNLDQLTQVGDRAYASGKWTVKDIFQHLIDAERVLAYRALRIGRNDQTALPGFDEALFAANVNPRDRSLSSLVDELHLVRQTTERLFASFDADAMQRFLTINGNRMSALAYGFSILGHQAYHLKIIEEKYIPLIGQAALEATATER
ncbi:MAG: DinB family protein [Blastocatellia bacterium]|nr:DinB family protein [Blastocatellia bacterium]